MQMAVNDVCLITDHPFLQAHRFACMDGITGIAHIRHHWEFFMDRKMVGEGIWHKKENGAGVGIYPT